MSSVFESHAGASLALRSVPSSCPIACGGSWSPSFGCPSLRRRRGPDGRNGSGTEVRRQNGLGGVVLMDKSETRHFS